MGALQKSRMEKPRRVTYDMRPIAAGAKGYKNGVALVITSGGSAGFYTEGNTTDTGVVKGLWAEDFDNTDGGNGDISANIRFFRERELQGFDNDTGTPVTNAMKEGVAYLLDDHTVTADVNGTPVGLIYEVSADGKTVWVEGDVLPPDAPVPDGLQVLKVELTVTKADLTVDTTDGTQSFNLGAALPTGAIPFAAHARITTAFTGLAAPTVDVGISSGHTIADNFDTTQTAGRYTLGEPGAGSYSGAQLTAVFTPASGKKLHTDSSAGSVTFDVYYFTAF
jgi:hypothetical protein